MRPDSEVEILGDCYKNKPDFMKRSLREIAELYGCDSSLQSIEEFRRSSGLDAITSMCFKAARISTVLIDDGFELDKIHDIQWHQNFVPSVGRILRIECLAEQILDEGSPDGGAWTLTLFIEAYVQHLNSLAGKIVGLKSIAAYRSGLEINTNVTPEEAENGLNDVLQAGSPVRLTNKNFLDHLFTCTLEVAVSFDLPIQIHTGFGDKDLDLRLSNPLHLRKVLEDSRFSKSRLVLLHASYPFSKEASYLASVYPQGFPNSVTPDYTPFQVWDLLQGLSTYVRMMLSTQVRHLEQGSFNLWMLSTGMQLPVQDLTVYFCFVV